MMPKVTKLSRQQAKEHQRKSAVLISIRNPGTGISRFGDYFAVFPHSFGDVDADHPDALTQEQAGLLVESIVAALYARRDIDVHCEMGVMRSGAVAKYIAESFGYEFVNDDRWYNEHVYRMLKGDEKCGLSCS